MCGIQSLVHISPNSKGLSETFQKLHVPLNTFSNLRRQMKILKYSMDKSYKHCRLQFIIFGTFRHSYDTLMCSKVRELSLRFKSSANSVIISLWFKIIRWKPYCLMLLTLTCFLVTKTKMWTFLLWNTNIGQFFMFFKAWSVYDPKFRIQDRILNLVA